MKGGLSIPMVSRRTWRNPVPWGPTGRCQTPRPEPSFGRRGHTTGHGQIQRPALEQIPRNFHLYLVTPAKAEVQDLLWLEQGARDEALPWIRAFAGMTSQSGSNRLRPGPDEALHLGLVNAGVHAGTDERSQSARRQIERG
jgi:hypothetical protein